MDGKISTESPLGKAILGHKVGERVYIKVNEQNGYYVEFRKLEKTTDDRTDKIRRY